MASGLCVSLIQYTSHSNCSCSGFGHELELVKADHSLPIAIMGSRSIVRQSRFVHPKRFIPYPFQPPAFNLWIHLHIGFDAQIFAVRAECISRLFRFSAAVASCSLVYCVSRAQGHPDWLLTSSINGVGLCGFMPPFYGGRPTRYTSSSVLVMLPVLT